MAPKKKKLTNKEKQWNRDFKKRMQAEGVLPPDKPKLNRKKFAKETSEMYRDNFNIGLDIQHLMIAMAFMSNDGSSMPISDQELGVWKLKRIAVELKMNIKNLKTNGDLYDFVANIQNM